MNSSRLLRYASWQLALAWLLALVTLVIVVSPRPALAAPAAGSQIGNQASATYTDDSQTQRTVTSNAVFTTVQQVAALTLSADGAKTATPGGQVVYAHTLTNTGNGSDSFALAAGESGGFGFAGVSFYADANGDGVADNATPITGTGALAAGAAFRFVAVGTVPGTASSGQVNTLTVSAVSTFDSALSAANTDTTTLSTGAVVNVTKAIDVGRGAPGSGPRTYTLSYTNTGNTAATELTLLDAIPSGMSYVAGSGRWSATGGTALTDAGGDDQGGIRYDYGVTTPGEVTAVIASLPAGASGRLSFQVMVNAGLPPGDHPATANTAGYRYHDGNAAVGPYRSNTAQFTVTQGAGLSLAGDSVVSAPQGGTVSFANTLTNTGNGSDTFDLSFVGNDFPAGTAFSFYQADGVTPMLDSNGNGLPDSGPLAPGAAYSVVVKAQLPPTASGGPYALQKRAASGADPAVTATASDTLGLIVGNRVDLTNDASGSGAPGSGAGPEATAVVSNSADPGAGTRFTLYVANGASVADSFDLAASTDPGFAVRSLPAGWSVIFRDASGAIVTNTGVINAGAARLIHAEVTIPAGAAPGTSALYFRALSPTSGAGDRIHDALTVNTVRALSLTPDGSGQAYPGGAVVYSHTIANTGNVGEGDGSASQVQLSLADSAAGFSANVYWDRNNDGVLDAGDPVVADLAALAGGSNGASTDAGLAPGEAATLFVKVYAPGSAAPGSQNLSTLTATASGTVNGVAAPAAVSSSDATTVIAGQISLRKTQATDTACSGAADGDYTATDIAAPPGACVRYRIVARNVGVANVDAVIVSDATPANTVYHGQVAAASSQGTVVAPADGSPGTIQAEVGSLAPGQEAVVTFGVRIQP